MDKRETAQERDGPLLLSILPVKDTPVSCSLKTQKKGPQQLLQTFFITDVNQSG